MNAEPLSYTVLTLQKLAIEAELERMEQEAAILERMGVDWGDTKAREKAFGDVMIERARATCPKRTALFAYIDGLSADQARLIAAMMYSGRNDGASAWDMWKDTKDWPEGVCKQRLTEKYGELREYLHVGSEMFRREVGSLDELRSHAWTPLASPPKSE